MREAVQVTEIRPDESVMRTVSGINLPFISTDAQRDTEGSDANQLKKSKTQIPNGNNDNKLTKSERDRSEKGQADSDSIKPPLQKELVNAYQRAERRNTKLINPGLIN